MYIKSVQKTTLIDYPGKIASTIFVGGCNFNCGFCYNQDLVPLENNLPNIPIDEIVDFLNNRKHLIEGVVITGGEPTIQPGLIEFLTQIRTLSLDIKLDTNGFRPEIIELIIQKKLVDYFAMDIKSDSKNYQRLCRVPLDIETIKQTIQLIQNSGVDYEFRTTVWQEWLNTVDIDDLLSLIKGSRSYFIQNFYNPKPNEDTEYYPISKQLITPFVEKAAQTISKVSLRGDWR